MSKINGTGGRRPGGGILLFKKGWDEEETPQIINKVTNNNNTFVRSKEPIISSKTTISINKETELKKNPIELETKLIDDILKPTGVTTKPSDSQLNEFIKRIKTFNKDFIYKILIDRIVNLGVQTEDQNQVKQLMKALYVIESILLKKVDGYQTLFSEQSSVFNSLENSYSNNKKICDITNNILILLGDRKPVTVSSNQTMQNSKNGNKGVNNNNVNLLDEIMSSNSSNKEETFSGLEIRNKNINTQTTNSKANGFSFIKAKPTVNTEEQGTTANTSNKELLNICGKNDKNSNSSNTPVSETSNKGGFNFIKTNKQTIPQKQSDELSNVFQNLNVVCKGETTQKSDNLNIALQETFNNKIDLDKLYSEKTNHNQYNNTQAFNNNISFPNQFNNSNISLQGHNISYYQNYNLNISDLTNNINIGENFVPLNMNDNNKIQETSQPTQETKNEKDHFDFVNEIMKKKK